MSYPSDFVTIQNAVIQKARLDSTLDLAKVKDWINQTYYRVCVEVEYYSVTSAISAPLAAQASSVAVPTNILGIDYIVPTGIDGSSWGPMEMVGYQEMFELRAWQGGTIPLGAPSRYAFNSATTNSIDFYPNAGGGETLTFYGFGLPPALVADADKPIFPEPYASKVLEYGTLCDASEFKKDIFMLNQYEQQYQQWVMAFRAFTTGRRGDRVMQFPVDLQRPYPRGNSVDTGLF